MKKISINFIIITFLGSFFSIVFSEGFAAGTLVKTPTGYEQIENLSAGDIILCFDSAQNIVERPVVYITKKHISSYARVLINNEYINLSPDQKFYSITNNTWFSILNLQAHNILSIQPSKISFIESIELKCIPIDIYLLSIAEHHNFFVTKANICAHNFFPIIIAGVSILFGSGAIEIAGISFGLAGLGTYLGYQWHKNKQKNMKIESISFNNTQQINDLYNFNDAQAPGMPTKDDGYNPPKNWDGRKVNNPNGSGTGWPDDKGHVWVPTGPGPKAHGGPHWDVQDPKTGRHRNILPGGRER